MFCIFEKNSNIQNGRHFFASEIFVETWKRLVFTDPLWIKNFAEITLSSTVFEMQAFLCFAFLKKIRTFKMAAIFLQVKYSLKLGKGWSSQIPCGSKILLKSLYLAPLLRYKHFCVLRFLQKIQNGRHFWWDKEILKTG